MTVERADRRPGVVGLQLAVDRDAVWVWLDAGDALAVARALGEAVRAADEPTGADGVRCAPWCRDAGHPVLLEVTGDRGACWARLGDVLAFGSGRALWPDAAEDRARRVEAAVELERAQGPPPVVSVQLADGARAV